MHTAMADAAQQVHKQAECLYTAAQVQRAIARIAEQITADMGHLQPVLLCVMNGGLWMTAELMQHLAFEMQVDYVHATRYRDATTGGQLQWRCNAQLDLQGRHVLVVDDILDEGITLHEITKQLMQVQPASLKIAVLTTKKHDRNHTGLNADYSALTVPDKYVYGYGMDYKGWLRNVSGIYAVTTEDAICNV